MSAVKTPRNVMRHDWGTSYSETRENNRAAKAWYVEAYEALGQVAPAKFAQEADDAQWEREYYDWHDESPEWYEEWLAEKDEEERFEAYVNSSRGQDAAFAHAYKGW